MCYNTITENRKVVNKMFDDYMNDFDFTDADDFDAIDGVEDFGADDLDLEDLSMDDLMADTELEAVPLDTDGDGLEDILGFDLDDNGELDAFMNVEGTNMVNLMDSDEDGIDDLFVITQISDADENGVSDGYIQTIISDDDGDDRPDATVTIEATDEGEDGTVDSFVVSEDYNGDGEVNMLSSYELSDEGEIVEVGSWDLSELAEMSNYTPYDGNGENVIGDPINAMQFWHPQEGNQCAVCSQEFVLESILGRDVDGDEFREVAEANGWYDENGTYTYNIGNLLEYYGVDVDAGEGRTYDDLRSALEDGNGVIVVVDSEELWSGDNEEFFFPGMDADHAIQVIGIDESDPDNVMVIVNDSGVANGQGAMVPLEDFMDAWEDSNGFMVEAFADSVN